LTHCFSTINMVTKAGVFNSARAKARDTEETVDLTEQNAETKTKTGLRQFKIFA
jgi:hypothetical protein